MSQVVGRRLIVVVLYCFEYRLSGKQKKEHTKPTGEGLRNEKTDAERERERERERCVADGVRLAGGEQTSDRRRLQRQ